MTPSLFKRIVFWQFMVHFLAPARVGTRTASDHHERVWVGARTDNIYPASLHTLIVTPGNMTANICRRDIWRVVDWNVGCKEIKNSNHKLSLVSICGRLVGGGRCPALAVIAVQSGNRNSILRCHDTAPINTLNTYWIVFNTVAVALKARLGH